MTDFEALPTIKYTEFDFKNVFVQEQYLKFSYR